MLLAGIPARIEAVPNDFDDQSARVLIKVSGAESVPAKNGKSMNVLIITDKRKFQGWLERIHPSLSVTHTLAQIVA
jgi:hypothetical protein